MKKIAISLTALASIPLVVGIILYTIFDKHEREFTNSHHKQTVMNAINDSTDISRIKLIAIHSELSEEKWQIIALNDLERFSYILFLLSLVNLAICIYIFSVTENLSDKTANKPTQESNTP